MFYHLKILHVLHAGHTEHVLSKVEIKDYNVMIDGKNFFDQSMKNNIKTSENLIKIVTDQGDR